MFVCRSEFGGADSVTPFTLDSIAAPRGSVLLLPSQNQEQICFAMERFLFREFNCRRNNCAVIQLIHRERLAMHGADGRTGCRTFESILSIEKWENSICFIEASECRTNKRENGRASRGRDGRKEKDFLFTTRVCFSYCF